MTPSESFPKQNERRFSDVTPGVYAVSPVGMEILPLWAKGLIESGYGISLDGTNVDLVEGKLRCHDIYHCDARISWGVRINKALDLAPEGTFFHGIPLFGNNETQVVVTTSTIGEGSATSFIALTSGRI